MRCRVQMITVRCVVDRVATFQQADMHVSACGKLLYFHGFHDNPGFDLCMWEVSGIRPNRSRLQSRHDQLQSAYLSAVGNCDRLKTSSASAKCQIARGFHVCTTMPATFAEKIGNHQKPFENKENSDFPVFS